MTYQHDTFDRNLNNLHHAMEYRDDLPHLRVTLGSDNITITGDVNILDNIRVNNSAEQSIPVYLTETGTVSITGPVGITGPIGITGPVSITGTVSVTGTFWQTTQQVSVTGPITIQQATGVPALVKYIDSGFNMQMDMTERLRVAIPGNSWWYAPSIDKDGDLRYIESFTGTGAVSTFVQNLSSISLSSGTDADGKVIRISRRRHKMRPGVSMLTAFSINWNGYDSGIVTKRAGVFTDFNGIFFEVTTDLAVVVRRRLADNSLVEKRIMREDFNIDKLNGTGTSGFDLSPVVLNQATITAYVSTTAVTLPGNGGTVYNVIYTVSDRSQFTVSRKFAVTGVSPAAFNGTVMVAAVSGTTGAGNITVTYITDPGSFVSLSSATMKHTALHHQYVMGFDYAGTRTTSVRFFINCKQGRVAIHTEDFGGELSTPFSNAPAMSIRYEVKNSSIPPFRPSLLISSEVINVEAELELNPGFGIAQRTTALAISKGDHTEYALLGVGLRAGEPYQRGDLQVQSIQIIDAGNVNTQNSGVFQWRLILNPTFGGTAVPTPTDLGKASRQWNYNNGTTITGGITVTGGYVTSTQSIDVKNALNFLNLGSNIEYTDTDKLILTIKSLSDGTSDASIYATMNFIEAL